VNCTLSGLGYVSCAITRQTTYQVKGLWRCEGCFDGKRTYAILEPRNADTTYGSSSCALHSRPSRYFEVGAKSPTSESISYSNVGRGCTGTSTPAPSSAGVDHLARGFYTWATSVVSIPSSRTAQSHPLSADSPQCLYLGNQHSSISTEYQRGL
jgi:hypothetical protein